MGFRYEIRLSGSGGQGQVFAAIVIAEAAGLYGNMQVSQTVSYGPQVRGGISNAEVVISDTEIDFFKATSPDLLLAMSQAACDANVGDLKEGGLLVVDSHLVTDFPPCVHASIPFTALAREIGNIQAANVVALGALSQLCGCLEPKHLRKALMERSTGPYRDINKKAFELGIREGKKAKRDIPLPKAGEPFGEEFESD